MESQKQSVMHVLSTNFKEKEYLRIPFINLMMERDLDWGSKSIFLDNITSLPVCTPPTSGFVEHIHFH